MHDNLHMHNGLNMHGLLFIEIGFHMSMLACGVSLAIGVLRRGMYAAATKAAYPARAKHALKQHNAEIQ